MALDATGWNYGTRQGHMTPLVTQYWYTDAASDTIDTTLIIPIIIDCEFCDT